MFHSEDICDLQTTAESFLKYGGKHCLTLCYFHTTTIGQNLSKMYVINDVLFIYLFFY